MMCRCLSRVTCMRIGVLILWSFVKLIVHKQFDLLLSFVTNIILSHAITCLVMQVKRLLVLGINKQVSRRTRLYKVIVLQALEFQYQHPVHR
ncbi:hypothetical protein L1887_35910 [Cichorium endivia]|nr:hypothetical protein L1887_35910 [Cichorium endivia]